MSLFRIAPGEEFLFPASFERAAQLATKILRSEMHTDLFCELWKMTDDTWHIDKSVLKDVLKNDEIFTIDKIRGLQYMNARACTIRGFDPFKIFFNAGLLLEMKDREKEEAAIEEKPITEWPDLLTSPSFWTNDKPKKLNTQHANVEFNSLVFIAQKSIVVAEEEAAKEAARKARIAKKEEAWQRKEEELLKNLQGEEERDPINTCAGVKRKIPGLGSSSSAVPAGEAPPHKQIKKEAPKSSDMNVLQKNTLMLTVLLVHETEHLLNRGLSSLVKGNTPEKKYKFDDPAYFNNIGHLMERHLYGYSIQHTYNELWPAAFAIDEILGSAQQDNCLEYILHPVPAFLALLNNPDSLDVITQKDIAMTITSAAESKEIKVGRPSTSWQPMAGGDFLDESTQGTSSSSNDSYEDTGRLNSATEAYFTGKP